VQDHSTATSKILLVTSYELKLLLRGFLLPTCLGAFFAYIIISLIDVERSGAFNTIPMSVVPIVGTIIVLKLLVYTRLEKTEIHRFRFIFLTLICLSIGGLIYVYYQFFAGIPAPFPSIADFFYLPAAVFLSFHLFSILRLKRNIMKANSFVYLGFLACIFPIYLLGDAIYNYEQYYPDSPIEFVTNAAYYISDAVLIFPCIPIILYTPKNDPFIFHWLLIALSVFIIVATDMAYNFSALDDEFLQNTEWLWSFFYTFAYILLIASIIWFSKLKQMLEYKKFSESLKNEQEMGLDRRDSANDFAEEFRDLNETLRAMKNITEKAEEQVDILIPQYIISKKEIINFINILVELKRKNKSLNIRILLPSPKFEKEEKIPSNTPYPSIAELINSPAMSIQYFDSPLNSNEIVSILDTEQLYILDLGSENTSYQNRFLIQHVNSESKIQVYSVLFERMWLLEKSLDFGQISK
jgi:hypothetical protein